VFAFAKLDVQYLQNLQHACVKRVVLRSVLELFDRNLISNLFEIIKQSFVISACRMWVTIYQMSFEGFQFVERKGFQKVS
jgi:hypothetical protein